jgi:hypothetical protein
MPTGSDAFYAEGMSAEYDFLGRLYHVGGDWVFKPRQPVFPSLHDHRHPDR